MPIALEKSISNLDIDLLNAQHADGEKSYTKCSNLIKSEVRMKLLIDKELLGHAYNFRSINEWLI